jgi:hypothetical protein
MMNRAYKTLGDKLRLGAFTLSQWAAITFVALGAITWAIYITPFGPVLTMVTTIYGAGVPIGLVLVASIAEFRPWLYAEAWAGYSRRDGRYLPGAGDDVHGYFVSRVISEKDGADVDDGASIDLSSLWS